MRGGGEEGGVVVRGFCAFRVLFVWIFAFRVLFECF